MPIEVKNLKRSPETMKFVKALQLEFGLEYEKDYDMSIHISEAKRMISNTRNPWKFAYQLPNCIRLDDGNGSTSFLVFNDSYTEDAFIKIVEFVANYLNASYEKW
ncbi:hypothetical protein ACOSZF_22980 [Cytobacillus firmus]|uniref:hypothetical protein n=1 Tax=Cytobacillus firmus TaxID=1399 RepID=UPI003BA37E69